MIIDTLHLYTQDTTTVSEKYRHSDLLAELNRHFLDQAGEECVSLCSWLVAQGCDIILIRSPIAL
jgi:hypothetical protein